MPIYRAVDEGDGGRVVQVEADAAVLLADRDVEVGVQLLRGARIVRRAAGGQHRQGAAAQQVVHAAAGGIAQARDFVAGENVEAAARVDAGVDGRERVGARGRGGVLGLGHPVVLSCSCRWLGTLPQRGRAGWGCTPTPRRSKAVGGVAPTYE